ncbi:DUF1428 family protein, partial [Shigella boydii]|uniref:DUF1428 family protein n=1 Tax=Shigella boydii TaxID=621 RepID=UPI000E5D25E2
NIPRWPASVSRKVILPYEVRDAANQKMMSDPRMKEFGESMPFDGKRMIYGGFESIIDE